MGSMEAEEALLKKKLEDTDVLEERREIRKQLRELRNRKFEEEVKKVTASDYRPGRDRTALTNGSNSSLGNIGRSASIKKDDEGDEDSYGLSSMDNEDDLQALLNDTPFTETDKRKKIRARLREVRNQKLGIGEPVATKRPQREKQEPQAQVETQKEVIREEKKESILHTNIEEPKVHNHNSFKSRYAEDKEESIPSKKSPRDSELADTNVARKSEKKELGRVERNKGIEDDVDHSRPGNKYDSKREDELEITSEKTETEDMVDETNSDRYEDTAPKSVEGEADIDSEERVEKVYEDEVEAGMDEPYEEDMPEDDVDYDYQCEEKQRDLADDVSDSDGIEQEKEELDDDHEDDEDEDVNVLDQDKSNDKDEQAHCKSNDKDEEDDDDDLSDEDSYAGDITDEKDASSYVEEDRHQNEERETKPADNNNEEAALDSCEEDNSEDLDDSEDEAQVRDNYEDKAQVRDEYKDEAQDRDDSEDEQDSVSDEEYSQSDDDEIEAAESDPPGKNEKKATDIEGKRGQTQVDYDDGNSEGYSDYTPTDEGSSVGGRRFEDDQNLDEYENADRSRSLNRTANYSPKSSDSLKRLQGPSYAAKVEKVFQEKEPGVEEGKDFKEKLKKTDKPFSKGGKKGTEQVDFRTVLRSAEKPKFFGDKPSQGAEQVDFRNLLQKKVNTKTLADKDLRAEQVDFRTVLKAGIVEKKPVTTRKTSTAEQVDFRTVLKKEPSVKSRKASTDDKDIFRKLRAGSDTAPKAGATQIGGEKKASERVSRPGRPSIDALKRSGSIDKAKKELDKQHADSTGSESDTSARKPSRLSLDALKESGDLGKTRDKSSKFEQKDESVFKKPIAPPPKQNPASKNVIVEDQEEMINERTDATVKDKKSSATDGTASHKTAQDKEPQSSRRQRRSIRADNPEPEAAPEKEPQEDEAESKVRSRRSRDREEKSKSRRSQINDESSEKPRSRRVIKVEEQTTEETSQTPNDIAASETVKESGTGRRSQDNEDRRTSLKSEDKRARNRRLRRDQNEAVKEVETKLISTTKVAEEEDREANESKSSNLERPAVQSSSTAKRRADKERRASEENQRDSDDEEIGMRRNRRRLVRKGSEDDKQPIRVSMKTEIRKNSLANENEIKITVATKSAPDSKTRAVVDADIVDAKPARATARKSGHEEVKEATDKKSPEDAAKSRQAKMASLDTKLADRRRQRAIENRKKHEQTKSSRMAFKEQLDANAPTTNGSSSPALQRANSKMTKLLHWCQRMTDGYDHVSVTNFTSSWADGMAFCALLHNFLPDKIPFDELSPKKSRRNFEIAFTAAAEEGVPDLLDVDDMVNMKSPDPKCVITYLHGIYQTLVSDRR